MGKLAFLVIRAPLMVFFLMKAGECVARCGMARCRTRVGRVAGNVLAAFVGSFVFHVFELTRDMYAIRGQWPMTLSWYFVEVFVVCAIWRPWRQLSPWRKIKALFLRKRSIDTQTKSIEDSRTRSSTGQSEAADACQMADQKS